MKIKFSRYKMIKELLYQDFAARSLSHKLRIIRDGFYSPYWMWKLFERKNPRHIERSPFSSKLSSRKLGDIFKSPRPGKQPFGVSDNSRTIRIKKRS